MDQELQKIIREVALAGITGAMTAGARALLEKGETPRQKLATFFAGVLGSAFAGYLLMHSTWSAFLRILTIGAIGAFVSTAVPILERAFSRYLKKKSDGFQSNNEPH